MIDKNGRIFQKSEIPSNHTNIDYCDIRNELERNDHNAIFLRDALEDLKTKFANFANDRTDESERIKNDSKFNNINEVLENMNMAQNSNINKINAVTSQIWAAMKTMKEAIQVHEVEIGNTISAMRSKDNTIMQNMKELKSSDYENQKKLERLKNLYENDKNQLNQSLEKQFSEVKYQISGTKEEFLEKITSNEKTLGKFINHQIEDIKNQLLPTSSFFEHIKSLIKSEIMSASEKMDEKIENSRKQLLDHLSENGLTSIKPELQYLKVNVDNMNKERIREKNKIKESLNIISDKLYRSGENLNSQIRNIDTRMSKWIKEKNKQMVEEIKQSYQERIKSDIQVEHNIIKSEIKNLQDQIDSLDYANNFNDNFTKMNELTLKTKKNAQTITQLKTDIIKLEDKMYYLVDQKYDQNPENSAGYYKTKTEEDPKETQEKESDDYTYLYSKISSIPSIKEKPNKSIKKLKKK